MGKSFELLRERLTRLIDGKRISKVDLSRKSGLDRSGLDKYLKGISVPSVDTLDKIADALDTKPWDLIKPEGEPIEKRHTILDCIKTVQNMKIEEAQDHTLSIKVTSRPPSHEVNALATQEKQPVTEDVLSKDILKRIAQLPEIERGILLDTIKSQLNMWERRRRESGSKTG